MCGVIFGVGSGVVAVQGGELVVLAGPGGFGHLRAVVQLGRSFQESTMLLHMCSMEFSRADDAKIWLTLYIHYENEALMTS